MANKTKRKEQKKGARTSDTKTKVSSVGKGVKKQTGKVKDVANLAEIAEAFTLEERLKVEKENWKSGLPRPVAKETVKLWLTIPPVLTGKGDDVLRSMGIVDDDVLAVARIRTQRELAKFIDVKEPVVSEWIGNMPLERDAFKTTKKFFRKASGNVLATLYRKSITEGDAARIKLYLQVIEDWKEQFAVEHSGGVEYNLEPEEKAKLDRLLALNSK